MAFGSQEVAGKTLKLFLDSQTGAMKIFTVTTKGFPSGIGKGLFRLILYPLFSKLHVPLVELIHGVLVGLQITVFTLGHSQFRPPAPLGTKLSWRA